MLRYRAREFVQATDLAEIQRVIDSILSTQAKVSNYAANSLFLDRIGLTLLENRDESYHSEALHFHLALLYGWMNEPERAAEHMALSNALPATGGDYLFSEHVRDSLDLRKQQQLARDRAMPPLLIAAMPCSAGATLTQTLSMHLNMPVLRLSVGLVNLVPSWVKFFADGGALTHDHFAASTFNLKVLGDCGIRDVFILVHDPRAAAASVISLTATDASRQTGADVSPEGYEAQVLGIFARGYVPWLDDWLACASQPPAGLRVHWIMSTDVRSRIGDVVSNMCETLEPLAKLSGRSSRAACW